MVRIVLRLVPMAHMEISVTMLMLVVYANLVIPHVDYV